MSFDPVQTSFLTPSNNAATAIPEIGLPSGRGTTIESAANTTLNTALNAGTLKGHSLYNGSVSQSDTQDYYRFDFANANNFNLLLSGFGANIGMQLLDGSGNVVQDLNTPDPANANAKSLSSPLTLGTYYVRVYSLDAQPTQYHLSLVNGNAYYVAPYGADTNSGGFAAPFRSVQQAANVAQAGSTVFVREGTYYERTLRLPNSGTSDQPITFAATPGETAVIDHGLQVPAWAAEGGGIYTGTPIFPISTVDKPGNTVAIVVDNQPLRRVNQRTELVEGSFWESPSTGKLFVWAAGGVDPSTKETLVLNRPNGQEPFAPDAVGIQLAQGVNHIVLDGFIDRAADIGVWATAYAKGDRLDRGLVVKNFEIKFAWSSAVRFDDWEGGLVDNSNIHNNGQLAFPRGRGNWPSAIIGYNSNNITISNSRVHNNNGEGVGPYKGTSNWKILNNVVYDNWSTNIYIDTDVGDIQVEGNLVYNTVTAPQQERDQPDGIRIANEISDFFKADATPGVYNVVVRNNVIINTGGGIQSFPYGDGASFLQNSVIENNTIANTYGNLPAITVERGDNVRVSNNIAYPNQIILRQGFGNGSIVADNNLFASPDPNSLVTTNSGVSIQNTKFGDPQFTSGQGFQRENYRSPANPGIGANI